MNKCHLRQSNQKEKLQWFQEATSQANERGVNLSGKEQGNRNTGKQLDIMQSRGAEQERLVHVAHDGNYPAIQTERSIGILPLEILHSPIELSA